MVLRVPERTDADYPPAGGLRRRVDLPMEYPYEIIPPAGQPGGMVASENCRYPRHIELDILEAGYTIRLHGKKITKTELRKENKWKQSK